MAHDDAVMSDALKDYANTTMQTVDIAAKHGVSPSTLTVWAKKAGIKLRGRGREKRLQPNARQREILLAAETLTQEEVGQRFGVTKQRVAKIQKRWCGWKRPKQAPFAPDDRIMWKRKVYTVIEAGPLFGKVRDESGNIIHNFYWHLSGITALRAELAEKNGQHAKGK